MTNRMARRVRLWRQSQPLPAGVGKASWQPSPYVKPSSQAISAERVLQPKPRPCFVRPGEIVAGGLSLCGGGWLINMCAAEDVGLTA